MKITKPKPEKCQSCESKIGDVFYDARLNFGVHSIWGNVCHSCFLKYGNGLGIGRGQKYRKAESETVFVKVS